MGYTQPQPALAMVFGNWWAIVLRRIAAVLAVTIFANAFRTRRCPHMVCEVRG
jgi:hypothetical protein